MNTVNTEKQSGSFANGAERTKSGPCYRPNVDIFETANELIVVADLPGTTRENVDLKFENGSLSIFAKVEPRDRPFLSQEYGVGSFFRSFDVNEKIDVEAIDAHYADGVLKLTLPKAKEALPRKIAVRAN